jgi:ATP-dependent DNA helicase RecG
LFFSYTQIDIVEFPDESGDTIREKTFKGPLHHHLREALIYIKNSILQEQVIKVVGVAEATRFYIYPFAAIEEVLSNAVYHKGYDEREPIEVGVEANRIIIVSHPGADR